MVNIQDPTIAYPLMLSRPNWTICVRSRQQACDLYGADCRASDSAIADPL